MLYRHIFLKDILLEACSITKLKQQKTEQRRSATMAFNKNIQKEVVKIQQTKP